MVTSQVSLFLFVALNWQFLRPKQGGIHNFYVQVRFKYLGKGSHSDQKVSNSSTSGTTQTVAGGRSGHSLNVPHPRWRSRWSHKDPINRLAKVRLRDLMGHPRSPQADSIVCFRYSFEMKGVFGHLAESLRSPHIYDTFTVRTHSSS